MNDGRALATVELLGALTYAQLRGYEVTVRAVRYAPDALAADRIVSFAERESAAYRALRERLQQLTDLHGPALDRQKPRTDAFFDNIPVSDWWSACTYLALGLPMASDFAREVAPQLDEATGAVVLSALAEREEFERYAIGEVLAALEAGHASPEETRKLAADITGSALTQFQAAITDTDALRVLLGDADDGDDLLRRMTVGLLERHRRRLHALGIDTPD